MAVFFCFRADKSEQKQLEIPQKMTAKKIPPEQKPRASSLSGSIGGTVPHLGQILHRIPSLSKSPDQSSQGASFVGLLSRGEREDRGVGIVFQASS